MHYAITTRTRICFLQAKDNEDNKKCALDSLKLQLQYTSNKDINM